MAVVPVRAIAERKVAEHFVEAGAVSMADAIPFTSARPNRQRAFDRLKGEDILRTDGKGKWWLDEARWEERRGNRLARAGMAMLAVAAVAAAAALR